MKNIYTLILACLLSVSLAKAQTDWVTHKGDDRISLRFPTTPFEIAPGSIMAIDKDSVSYIFTIVDFVKVAGIDSATLAPIKDTKEFADEMKTGMKQTLPDVDLADFTIGKWKGFTSYRSSGVDSLKRKYEMFMLIIGSNLYSLSTISWLGVDTDAFKKFVNSVTLNN